MKKRWPFYLTLALVSYVFFVIANTPASWLAWGLIKVSNGAVRLDAPSGSIWSGHGKLMAFYPRATPHELGETEWSINPLWLLTGRLRAGLKASTPDSRMTSTITLSYGSLALSDTEIVMAAPMLGKFYAPAGLIGPEGTLRLKTGGLTLGREGMEGTARLVWQGAGSGLSPVRPLGDYRLEITGEGEKAALKLVTEKGDLKLDGQGTWHISNGRIRFNGTATPRARAKELEPLLNVLGNDRGGGTRALVLNTRLPFSFGAAD